MSVSSKKPNVILGITLLLVTVAGLCLFSFLFVPEPVLSHDSGFYDEAFTLHISVPANSKVYYTLDGSVPDRNSHLYTEPLTIVNNSRNPNTYSMLTDVVPIFNTDLIETYAPIDIDYYPFQAPDYLIDKCTVLRAVAINPFGITSEIITQSYFVELPPERYPNCNILSLVTDPDNLFDPETGIYVTGKTFRDYVENNLSSEQWRAENWQSAHWRFWDANYRQRGADWEREATMQFFDTSGKLFLDENGGIRIRGGISRSTLPRSLNLYARDASNKTDTFRYPLFGNDFIPDAVSLSAGGNQLITQFNDYMMTQRSRNRNMATVLFEPYVLFLNGEYWGYYWMTEKFNETYFAHYYGIDPNNCIIVKDEELEAGRTGDLDLYLSMVEYILTHDLSIQENYDQACELMDIDSFLDYFCTMAYIAREEDWPWGNWAMWRTRLPENSPYGDTKWRWILFDCNSTCMSSYEDNTSWDTLSVILDYPLFASFWRNPYFQEIFRQRILEIADTDFNPQEMDAFIQEYTKTMEPLLAQSWKRFYGSENELQTDYYDTMERIRQFFLNRKPYVEAWFVDSGE